jgi:hypothetical protein
MSITPADAGRAPYRPARLVIPDFAEWKAEPIEGRNIRMSARSKPQENTFF